ncbi:MAG: hypothetical protein R3E56_19000 [Burkholderiaceae bacterium]
MRLRLSGHEASSGEVFVALLVDVGVLTLQLYLSGGTANPFALYLPQVTSGAAVARPVHLACETVITVCALACWPITTGHCRVSMISRSGFPTSMPPGWRFVFCSMPCWSACS